MDKQTLLSQLEEGLTSILAQMTHPENRHAINLAIKFFILEDAGRCTVSELISRFSTMEEGLQEFLSYLESDKMPKSPTIH